MWSSTFKAKIGTTASVRVCPSASCLSKLLTSTQHCLADDWQVTWLFTKLEFTAVTCVSVCVCARAAEALFHVSDTELVKLQKAAVCGVAKTKQKKKEKVIYLTWYHSKETGI